MPEFVVVVNGVPGAGKTSLAAPLAAELGMRLVAKDAIKEALSDAAGGGLPTRRVGALAADNLWTLAAMEERAVMVESFWATDRDEPWVQQGLARLGDPPGVEVWCEVPIDLAVERFRSRARHPVHSDTDRLDEMPVLASRARPITGLPVIRVQTDAPVDVRALADRIRGLRSRSVRPTPYGS